MGRCKDLAEAERDARWQEHFNNYVIDNFGGRSELTGREHDEAADYANCAMEEEDGFEP